MTFSERLKDLRKLRNLNMKEFSKQSSIPYNTIISLESRGSRGTAIPNIITIRKIASFYNITVDKLIENVEFIK